MPRYWVIAPVESKNADLFDKVWQFDVTNRVISIGWSELGDISKLDRESLAAAIASTYANKPPTTRGLYANMLWSFYHEVAIGDFVIARRGRKTLEAIGKVVQLAEYAPGKNLLLAPPGYSHDNFLGIEWQKEPRNKTFGSLVFPMHTLTEFSEEQYRSLLDDSGAQLAVADVHGQTEDRDAPINADIVLEKYLEEFIVSNFDAIFKGKYQFYVESEEVDGQQYPTDIGSIDILAVEQESNAFVVIELKKGRPSDQVVGQILRYMGWVRMKLCKDGQPVKGLIICHDPDPKLSYALQMTQNIDVRYYSVSFNLRENP
jgi:restriction system protein